MDSPSSVLTNVLKIDNLSRVPYAIYEPSLPDNSHLLSPTTLADRQCDVLREVERTLKAEGVPVLSDFEKCCLWVFHIHGIAEATTGGPDDVPVVDLTGNTVPAGHTKDDRWVHLEERLQEEWQFIETATGVFLASSLAPQYPNEPVMIDLTLDDVPEPIAEPILEEFVVYGHLIAAVLSVITFCLASREGFTPLNSRTLVSSSSLPVTRGHKSLAERHGKEEILPSRPVADPDLVTPLILELEAYMTSAGTLVVIPHSEKQKAIQRVGTSDLTPSSLQSREVFIAPWGEWGRLLPAEAEPENPLRKRAEEKWKDNVMSYLKDRGIVSTTPIEGQKESALQEAIEQGEWLNVEIWLRPLTDLSMGDLHQILWPKALLFLRSSEGDKRTALPIKENSDFWKSVFDDPEYTQLAWGKLASLISTLDTAHEPKKTAELDAGAEWWSVQSAVHWSLQWFKGRDERAKKIKEHVEEKRRKELQEHGIKEEKITAEKGKGGEAKQGPGGVYPTPPDGAASVLTGGPASTSSTGAADMSTAFTAGGGSGMDVDWPGESNVANNDHMIPQRETDLFGDGMEDMDMKVTEDDFDFFDNQPDFGEVDNTSGGMDVDIGGLTGQMMNMGAGNVDMRMSSPSPVQTSAPGACTAPPAQKPERNKKRSRMAAPPELKEIPPLPSNQVRTPPLSPHRAIGWLVPGYQPPTTNGSNFTPPASGGFKKPSTALARTQKPTALPRRRSSMYSPITFTDNVEMVDQKYALGGRFFLSEAPKGDEYSGEDVTKINRSHSLKRKRRIATASEFTLSTPAVDDTPIDFEGEDTSSSEWESDSEESDADDSTDDEEYYTSPSQGERMQHLGFLDWVKKRKWPSESGTMEVDTPEGLAQRRDVAIGVDGEVDIVPELAPPPWRRMQPEPVDETLIGAFEDISLTSEPLTLTSLADVEFQEVSAVLAGQVNGWVHSSWREKNETLGDDEEDMETSLIRRRSGRDQNLVEDVIKGLFREGVVVRCSLETYAAIADSIQEPPPIPPPPPLGHGHFLGRASQTLMPNLSQRRNKDDNPGKNWEVFLVPPPHVRLQRGDNVLEMLAPALYFWETFSLAPISGNKNVISFCFHPASGAMREGADFLLERVGSSYEAGRFGMHVRAEIDGVVENGLVPVEIPAGEPQNYENGMKAMLGQLEGFGAAIAHGVGDEGMNVVIYVVNPFEHPASLVDICASFVRMQRLYEACIATLPEAKPNHLVLQIVPANFVAHKLGGVMRVGIVHHLAVEVYNRCIPTDTGTDYAEAKRVASPPIQLARPIPQKIEFRLTPDPSPALLKENQLLHIAYSQSLDERWVSVAWSDNTGSVQKTATINLGRRNSGVLRPFTEVLNEIWDATADLIKYPAVRWRLAITKVCSSTMPADEVETWKALVATHDRVSATYLLSADLQSPFRISELLPDLKMDNFWPQANLLYSTPPVLVNTPTPTGTGSIVSPDASAAATPGGPEGAATELLDPDAELVDATDESWGVVLAHTLPVRGEVETRRRCARPTGLLLRRGEEWSVTATVSVVEGGGTEFVREVLETWRGLAVLGHFMGTPPGVPWMLAWCQTVEEIARVM
ncbi:mediator complex subunit 13 C-terminal-domain-containing protein [Sphaerosporella brunnea]|uniref:Mediator of RNA polymerase II transcription subunit 13 n=1 Tax=Sphaerosporella brunnea TaxID=1250544 RepID=A0A5J5F1U9_9PEZI|nr:mediator complex subunit 13 C-terminal-domain-containing protein [Sphaerosporella brunnea]